MTFRVDAREATTWPAGRAPIAATTPRPVTRGVRRVLFVHYTTPQVLGGVEQVMAAHAAALVAAGKDVAVLAGRGGTKPRGARVIRVAEADSRHPLVERSLATLATGVRSPEHDSLVALS